MQTHRMTTFGAVLAALALVATTGQAFLFDDGTFETPIASFEDGQGWEAFGTPDAFAAIGREDWANGAPGTGGNFGYAASGDGQFGLVFKAFSGSAGGFYHDVPVEPGRQYTFHIQSHTATVFFNQVVASGSGTVAIVFGWYDGDPTGGGALLGAVSNNITSSLTNGGGDSGFPPGPTQASRWQNWDYSGLTAPAGSEYLRATVQWTGPGTFSGGDETVRWDNAQLTTSLNPVNEVTGTDSVMQLTYNTQDTVNYAIEATADLDLGFGVTGFPQVSGDGSTQQVSFLPATDVAAVRLMATEFGSTDLTVQPFDEAGGDNGWEGFMNVFELPAPGSPLGSVGGFVFGSGWGVPDLVSDINTTTNGGNTAVTLSPNTIDDPNEFWYQNTSGTATPPNVGGPGQKGNKTMDANLFITYTDSALAGQTVTFSGTVLANSLTGHLAVAFIKDFAPDYSSNVAVTTNLTPGPFSISLATSADPGRHIQHGFTVTGPNVWVTDTAPFGNVQIATESSSFLLDDVDTGLGLVPGPVVTWDGQLGVHYIFEYSDNGGANWFDTGAGTFVGTGGQMKATDPAGLTPGRTYRISTPPMVPLGP